MMSGGTFPAFCQVWSHFLPPGRRKPQVKVRFSGWGGVREVRSAPKHIRVVAKSLQRHKNYPGQCVEFWFVLYWGHWDFYEQQHTWRASTTRDSKWSHVIVYTVQYPPSPDAFLLTFSFLQNSVAENLELIGGKWLAVSHTDLWQESAALGEGAAEQKEIRSVFPPQRSSAEGENVFYSHTTGSH